MTGNNNNQSNKGKGKARRDPTPENTSATSQSAIPHGPDWDTELYRREQHEHERREHEHHASGRHIQAPHANVSQQTVPIQNLLNPHRSGKLGDILNPIPAQHQSHPAHSAHSHAPHNPPHTSAPTMSNLLAPSEPHHQQPTRQTTHPQPHAQRQPPPPPTRQNTDPMPFVPYDPHAPRSYKPYAPRNPGDGEHHAHRNPSPKQTAPPRKPPANPPAQHPVAHANPPNSPPAPKKKAWNAKQQYGQVAFATSRQGARDHDTGEHIGTETWLTRNPSIPGAPTRGPPKYKRKKRPEDQGGASGPPVTKPWEGQGGSGGGATA